MINNITTVGSYQLTDHTLHTTLYYRTLTFTSFTYSYFIKIKILIPHTDRLIYQSWMTAGFAECPHGGVRKGPQNGKGGGGGEDGEGPWENVWPDL